MTARCQHGAAWWREDCPGCMGARHIAEAPFRGAWRLTLWRVRGEPPLRLFIDTSWYSGRMPEAVATYIARCHGLEFDGVEIHCEHPGYSARIMGVSYDDEVPR